MPFVRTVLGDIAASQLGVTYAHEHLVIDGGRPVELEPDFLLADVTRMAIEVREAAALGLRSVIDAMPADAGRNVVKLAELSRLTSVNVVAPTGLHHERYYGPTHWSTRIDEDELADLFTADVEDGIDANDYSGPVVRRTAHRAGIVKVAGSAGGPSERDTRIFAAAAETHRRTGVPILTHCEGGTGALEQLRLLDDLGVPAAHVTLSHVDKVVDRAYHRELLATGASAAYDQAFRWGDQENGTLTLLEAMIEDGLADRIVLGMDAARQGYYKVYGGRPGLTYLLDEFSRAMADRGIDEPVRDGLFVANPARAFAFARERPPDRAIEGGRR
jgi:5-phospho-D-xylono-1,4-lactonase